MGQKHDRAWAESGLRQGKPLYPHQAQSSEPSQSHHRNLRSLVMLQDTQQCHGTRAVPCNMKPATEHRQCIEPGLPWTRATVGISAGHRTHTMAWCPRDTTKQAMRYNPRPAIEHKQWHKIQGLPQNTGCSTDPELTTEIIRQTARKLAMEHSQWRGTWGCHRMPRNRLKPQHVGHATHYR